MKIKKNIFHWGIILFMFSFYAILITLITNSINQAWNPWFHDNYALKNYELIKEKVIPLIAFGCYIGIGCIAVAPEAIKILGGEQYMSGLQAVLPIALGVVIEFVYTQYVIIEMHLKRVICNLDEYARKRRSRCVEEAVKCVKHSLETRNRVPTIKEMGDGFAWLYLPRSEETLKAYPEFFNLSGDDKYMIEKDFMESHGKWKSYEDFVEYVENLGLK